MKFVIDEQFLCSVSVVTRFSSYSNKALDELTPEELVKIMKEEDVVTYSSTMDHPEFTKLRDQLEQLGYIKTQRNWWNGDTVLKPFYLNEWKFKKNTQFSCADALQTSIKCARKYGWKSLV
jgi:hypothetical protein